MTTRGRGTERKESCDDCGRETLHRVTIEFRVDGERSRSEAYSREPRRVSACVVCGATSRTG